MNFLIEINTVSLICFRTSGFLEVCSFDFSPFFVSAGI